MVCTFCCCIVLLLKDRSAHSVSILRRAVLNGRPLVGSRFSQWERRALKQSSSNDWSDLFYPASRFFFPSMVLRRSKKHVRSPSAYVLSTLAVNKPTKRNVKTMRKENPASWVDLFYRLAPLIFFKLTPQNTLKYIRYWFWRFWSTFQLPWRLVCSSQKSITGKIINFGKIYQTIAPALRINDNWTKRGLLCCTLPIILFQWLGNLRAIYKCNQMTFTCTLCHGQDRAEAHFFNYRSLCYAF